MQNEIVGLWEFTRSVEMYFKVKMHLSKLFSSKAFIQISQFFLLSCLTFHPYGIRFLLTQAGLNLRLMRGCRALLLFVYV